MEDLVWIIEVIGILFDIFCFEVVIVSYEDVVDVMGVFGVNLMLLFGVKDVFVD